MVSKFKNRIFGYILVLIIMMCITSTTVYSAEMTTTLAEQQSVLRSTVYSSSWSFKHQMDSSSFSASSGQSVSIAMNGINSNSSQGFSVQVCKVVNGNITSYSGTIHVDANKSVPYTVTFGVYDNGTYLVRATRTNDGISQNINSVKINVAG